MARGLMQADTTRASGEAGFSMLELIITLGVMVVILMLSSQLIVGSFNVRKREDAKSDAVADTQNALNIMTREIISAGCSLPSGQNLPANGIVPANSDSQSIRIVSNPNSNGTVSDADEDVLYRLYTDTSTTPNQQYIVRYSVNSGTTTVLANRIDGMRIRYYDQKVSYDTVAGTCDISNVTTKSVDASGNIVSTAATESTDKTKSTYLVIAVCVTLPQVGTPGAPDYRAAWQVQLTSDVALRNSNLAYY